MRNVAMLVILGGVSMLSGCSEPKQAKEQPQISQKVRVQNLQPRIEKTYRLSETETVKVLIMPGWPMGEKCVIYTNGSTSTMQCREALPHEQ